MATSTEPELDGDGSTGPPAAAGEPASTTRADVFIYVARKLGALVLVSLLVATLTFVVSRATADPSFLMVGQDATDEIIAARRAEMGLDQPMYRQWASYMADLARGDLGISRRTFAPVGGEIWERLPATVELAGAALLLSLLVAIPGGIRAGLRPEGWADRIVGSVAQLGAAIPNFWLGLMLIYFGFYWLGWFPAPTGRGLFALDTEAITGIVTIDALIARDWTAARESIRHLLLPAVTLASGVMPPILNVTRNATVSVVNSPYYEAALSFGVSRRTVKWRLLLPNIAAPVINILAITIGFLMGGAVLVEVVFSWPGIGKYAVDAMDSSDYNPVLGVVLLASVTYVLVYQIADLVTFAMDPRLRISR